MTRASRVLVVISLAALTTGCADRLVDRPVGSGKLVFTGSRGGDPVIYSVNTDGTGLVPIETRLTSHAEPAWSPDGTQIAFAGAPEGGGDYPDIYVMNADGTNLRQLTSEPRVEEGSPAWSPDGTMIVFSRLLNRGRRLFVVDVGSGEVRQLTDDATFMDSDPDWSPDGTQIVFMRNADSFPSIYVIDADGTNLRRLTTEHGDTSPAWSPDGGQIAFVRDEQQEGEFYLYVMDADGSNLSRLAAGSVFESRPFVMPEPAWSPDGVELGFFRATSLVAIRPDGSGETSPLSVSKSVARLYLGQGGVDWAAL